MSAKRRPSIEIQQRKMEEWRLNEQREHHIAEIKKRIQCLQTDYKSNLARLHELEAKAMPMKPDIQASLRTQLDHYCSLLYAGHETRNIGLSWIIKTIWYLGGRLDSLNFPSVLDPESAYLTEVRFA